MIFTFLLSYNEATVQRYTQKPMTMDKILISYCASTSSNWHKRPFNALHFLTLVWLQLAGLRPFSRPQPAPVSLYLHLLSDV